MQFGMPTIIEIDSLEKTVKLAAELSLSFVELNMNLPQYQPSELEKNIRNLVLLKEKYGIYFTIHLDENLNVCDFNNDVRGAYIQTVLKTIEIARRLEAPVLNMHMNHGVHFTLPDRKVRLSEQYKDVYLWYIYEFGSICEKAVGKSDIKICIENTNGYFPNEKEAISILLENNVFYLTWDIGHSNAVGDIDEDYIMSNENKLAHFHIHDSLGKSDHLTLGSGEIDLNKRLSLADKHNCRCVVETKTEYALRESVNWLNAQGYLYGN